MASLKDMSEFDDLIKGWEMSVIMQLRTPLMWLQRHREFHEGAAKPREVLPPKHACWVPVPKTWRDLGIDEDEVPETTMASEVGQIPADGGEFLPFLLEYRMIVEDGGGALGDLADRYPCYRDLLAALPSRRIRKSKEMASRSSLEVQCEQIGWPLDVVRLNYYGHGRWNGGQQDDCSPEEVAIGQISAEGYQCSWCEGGAINLLMKAASLDVLTSRNVFGDRKDAVRGYLEAQLTLLGAHRGEILSCIESIVSSRLQDNIEEICADELIQSFYPKVRRDFLLALACAVEPDFIAEVASVFMIKPYEYRSGWPDLTVISDTGISFVEVKTTDLLHRSQLRFAQEVAKPLALECRVIQLKPTIR